MKYRYFTSFVVPPKYGDIGSLNEMFKNVIVELPVKVENAESFKQLESAIHKMANAANAGSRSLGFFPAIISFQLLAEIS